MENRKKIILILVIGAMLILGTSSIGFANEYPTHTITVIMPGEVGGVDDIELRLIIPFLEKSLGVPVVVEDMPGAGGARGMNELWKAQPDGYTLGASHFPSRLIGQLMFPENADYDQTKLKHIAAWMGGECRTYLTRINHPQYKTIEDVIKASKDEGKLVTVGGGGGLGSSGHLQVMLTNKVIGTNLVYVPYDGTPPSLAALLGGHVDLVCQGMGNTVSLSKEKDYKVLALNGRERVSELPDVPTFEELGYSGLILTDGTGMWAPPGTPDEIVDKLEQAIKDACENEEFIKQMKNMSKNILFMNSEEFLEQSLYDYNNLSPIVEMIKKSQ